MTENEVKVLAIALAANVLSTEDSALMVSLANHPSAVAFARTLGNPKLVRQLSPTRSEGSRSTSLQVDLCRNPVIYKDRAIGRIQILFKSPLPGELQARLATESAIDLFLEYLQKLHQIVVLDESDRHVRVFIPSKPDLPDFSSLWQRFLRNVAFSAYGDTKHQLPGLVQTFIAIQLWEPTSGQNSQQ